MFFLCKFLLIALFVYSDFLLAQNGCSLCCQEKCCCLENDIDNVSVLFPNLAKFIQRMVSSGQLQFSMFLLNIAHPPNDMIPYNLEGILKGRQRYRQPLIEEIKKKSGFIGDDG